MSQPSPVSPPVKRFPRARRVFWKYVFGVRAMQRRAGYYAHDAQVFWRSNSHAAGLFPGYVRHYAQLYRIYKKSFAFDPRRKTIAISLTEHLGDIVACEPVARYVREQNPDAHIVWVVNERYRALVEHHPAIDEIMTVKCLTEWMQMAGLPLLQEIIELHLEGRFCTRCRIPLKKLNGNPEITGKNYYRHGSLQAGFCLGAGLPDLHQAPQMYIPAQIRQRVDRLHLPERYIVLHTRSNETSRDWLPERWSELVRELAARQYQIIEVGVNSGIPNNATATGSLQLRDLCGKLAILETAEVIRRAQLFIGIDSGPAQMANALQTPGVILLGKYRDFEQYMPYTGAYEHAAYADLIRAEGPASTIPAEQVLNAALARLHAAEAIDTNGAQDS